MAYKIGVGLAIDGEAEFKAALKEVNNELKLLNSEANLVKETYKNNANSLEALTAKHEILTKQLEQTEKKVQLNREQMESWQKVQNAAAEKTEELKKELSEAQEKMEDMKKTSSTTEDELKDQQKAIDELNKELENAENTYQKAGEKANKYQINLNNAETQVQKLNRELKENGTYMEEAEKSTDGTASSIDEFGKKIGDATKKTEVFGEVLKANLASAAIENGIRQIANGIKEISTAAVSVGKTFESSMSQVAATMGMTADEIAAGSKEYDLLKNAAGEAGKATKYSASEAADALNYLALAGYDAQKSADTLPKVLNLAAAGGLDLAYASDLVTDSMAALGMETSDLDKYIDEMARTAQKSNTSVAQLGEATLVCAGTVTMTQQSLETMNAELGILANNGIKGAEGGTHLRNILLSLVTPTDKASEVMAELGIKVADNQGNIRNLNDILTDLNGKLNEMSEEEKSNVLNSIFNKTDITAINSLLKGTGQEFDALNGELKGCTGAAEDMAETMNANLTGKVTILQSALEALGISAYEKIEGTLKDSVDAATDSVGNLQSSMDDGELGRAMDNFAESLGNAAEGAIDFAEDALPVLINGLSWILDNSDLIISGVAGIASAELYHGTIAPMIQATSEAWNAYKKANEGATVAQWAMNAAQSANPMGLLITAIAGLIGFLGTYTLLAGNAADATNEMLEKNRENIDAINEGIEKRKESTSENEIEVATIKKLKEEISALNEKENLSNEEKSRMAAMVGELNQALPELNLEIDEQTGKLAENTEGWEKNVESQLAALEMQFKQEDLTEIAKERYEAEKQLMDLEEQIREQEEETTAAREKYNSVMDEMRERYGEQTELYGNAGAAEAKAAEDSIAAQEELQQQYEETQKIIDDLTNEYDDLSQGIQETSEAAEESTPVLVNYKDQTYEIANATMETTAKLESLQQAYQDAQDKAAESITSQVQLFQELSIQSDLNIQQMTSNLQSQTEAFNTYSSDLKTAAELAEQGLLGDGLLGAIQELGMDGAGYLHELVTAAETDSEKFNEMMRSWTDMTEAKENLINTMADVQTDYSDQMDVILGIADEKDEELNAKVTDTTDGIKETVVKANGEITDNAEKTMKTVNDTVKKEGATVTKTSTTVAKDTVTGVKTELGIGEDGISTKFKEIGKAIDDGMIAGIQAGKADVINAAVEVALAAYKAAKEALGINSPSKLFRELGYWSSEGYAEGMITHMEDVKGNIQDSMRAVADAGDMLSSPGLKEGTENGMGNGSYIETMQLVIQPQTLSEEDMDMAFDYVNRRLGANF